jgi:hypothetical protein
MTMRRILLGTAERKKRGSQVEFFLINSRLSLLRNFPPILPPFFRNDHTAKPPSWRGWISLDLAYLIRQIQRKTNLPL